MYNAELKEQFILQATQNSGQMDRIRFLFNLIAPYEESAGEDICTMGLEDAKIALKGCLGFRTSSVASTLTLIKDYVRWCAANSIPGANEVILTFKPGDFLSPKEYWVSGPMHLKLTLDRIFDPEDLETVELVYRGYFWFAFMGVQDSDIMTITEDQFDFRNMLLDIGNNSYHIYPESLPTLNRLCDLQDFRYIHPLYPEKEVRRNRVPGNIVMRGVRSVSHLSSLKTKISHYVIEAVGQDESVPRISYDRVWTSGWFYRIRQLELAGVKPDFGEMTKKYKKWEGKNKEELRAKQYRAMRFFSLDYSAWKNYYS